MSDCTFCEQGVRPFYDLNMADGIKRLICHTCFHIGKHKSVRPGEQGVTKSQPVATSPGSTATKK